MMIALGLFVLFAVPDLPYDWRSVKIGGGGFVSGIVTHPKEKDLVYARTDIGGAYRWDAKRKRWVPLQDWLTRPDWNLYGVESLALDPSDPKWIYIAAGTYTNQWGHNGAILRSSNQGKDWDRIMLDFKNGGNMPGRSIGERLVVDPSDGRVLFFGTRGAGLYRSSDRGSSWSPVANFGSVPKNDIGVGWIVFDPTNISGPTQHLFAAVEGATEPIRESEDGGSTWHELAGQPAKLLPMQAKLQPDGKLDVVYSDFWGPNDVKTGEVWQYNLRTRAWHDITPEKPAPGNTFGYAGVTLDPANPGVIMVSTLCRWTRVDTVFRTTDGGRSWISLNEKAVRDTSPTPFLNWDKASANFGHWIGDVEIDPFNPNRAWYVTGATIFETEDLGAADRGETTHWRPSVDGIEETAVIKLVSPPKGASVVSALGDIAGFRHDDLTQSPPAGMWRNPTWGTTMDLDYAGLKADRFIRVGWNNDKSGAISEDGAATWRPFPSNPPGSKGGGSAAISADGSTIVWSPNDMSPWLSRNGGVKWIAAEGAPKGGLVLSDKTDPRTFYIQAGGNVYVSHDGGSSFEKGAGELPDESGRLINPVGRPGDLWLPTPKGLYRSKGGGAFRLVPGLDSVEQIGFGRGGGYPMLYAIGVRFAVPGVYRSADEGRSWIRINDKDHGLATMQAIAGDPKVEGRVYVGTNGRGIWVADPVSGR